MKTVRVLGFGLLLLSVLLPVAHAGEETARQGQALFEARCALCHQLPEPSALKAGQWRLIITTMQKRIRHKGMVALSAEEQEKILAYLSLHAKQ